MDIPVQFSIDRGAHADGGAGPLGGDAKLAGHVHLATFQMIGDMGR